MRIKCPTQEHNTMSPWRTNHEATASSITLPAVVLYNHVGYISTWLVQITKGHTHVSILFGCLGFQNNCHGAMFPLHENHNMQFKISSNLSSKGITVAMKLKTCSQAGHVIKLSGIAH